ncbi:MAG: mechanosensitive ion channel [Bacteroidota bacterium]|nr:mechanosensitive ion channel [Bacteroidota bacterium]
MDIIELDISGNTIFRFLFSTFVLFLVFRFVHYLIRAFENKSARIKSFNKFIPLIEMFAWVVFLIWAANKFLNQNKVLAIVSIIILSFILFWISFYALRNIIAGVLFRFHGNYLLGDYIKTKDYSGKIQKFTFFSLHIENAEGQSVFIPYSKLLNKANVRYDSETSKAGFHFKIITPKDETPDEKLEKIKLMLLNMPWVSTGKMPYIKQVNSDDDSYTFEVVLFAVNTKYALKTENLIKDKFGINTSTSK